VALFSLSSGLLMIGIEEWAGLQLVPAGASILGMTAAQLAGRHCARQLLLNAPGEMLEAAWRLLPLGAYAACRDIPLEYRRPRGGGLLASPRQWFRHVRDHAVYDKANVFTAARILDGGLVSLANLLPNASVGAALLQGATMLRTPLLAAYVLPRLDARTDDPAFQDDERNCEAGQAGTAASVIDIRKMMEATESPLDSDSSGADRQPAANRIIDVRQLDSTLTAQRRNMNLNSDFFHSYV
jgi:hypothetical protein